MMDPITTNNVEPDVLTVEILRKAMFKPHIVNPNPLYDLLERELEAIRKRYDREQRIKIYGRP